MSLINTVNKQMFEIIDEKNIRQYSTVLCDILTKKIFDKNIFEYKKVIDWIKQSNEAHIIQKIQTKELQTHKKDGIHNKIAKCNHFTTKNGFVIDNENTKLKSENLNWYVKNEILLKKNEQINLYTSINTSHPNNVYRLTITTNNKIYKHKILYINKRLIKKMKIHFNELLNLINNLINLNVLKEQSNIIINVNQLYYGMLFI